jgi:hypothetical protein
MYCTKDNWKFLFPIYVNDWMKWTIFAHAGDMHMIPSVSFKEQNISTAFVGGVLEDSSYTEH